ncbi:MAG: hypothetical protein WA902_05775, partial [Thermosynechococcaceae cyanobacterium]
MIMGCLVSPFFNSPTVSFNRRVAKVFSNKTNGSNELCQLEKLLNQETIGRLKRESEVTYLESLANIRDCWRIK